MENSNTIIQFLNVTKNFPGVKALDSVSFEVQEGHVHALLGENGAGKSTLLSVLHGNFTCDSGQIFLNSKSVHFKSVNEAQHYGITLVHQEVNLVEELTVGQNIALGFEPTCFSMINYKNLYLETDKVLNRLGCNFSSKSKIHALSVGEMQMVSIAKALYHKVKVLSLDEPTASLSNREVEVLFRVIAELKKDKITVIYVSHRLDEIFQIADAVTILRDGSHISTVGIDQISKSDLIKKMVGRDVSTFATRTQDAKYKERLVLEVKNLSRKGVFNDISFSLREGEILGFAGLVGSKRTDVMRAIFGADKKSQGTILVKGKEVSIRSPNDALKVGVGLIPENRKTQGFVKYFNNAENIGLSCMEQFIYYGFINHNLKVKNSMTYIEQMQITPSSPSYNTALMSGGNQQKVIIAKWLASRVDILILDEPTKGIDVGAKAEIYKLLEDLISEGKSIIIVSSELPELIGMSDRVVVMKEGNKIIELDRSKLSEECILAYAMGGRND